MLRDPYFLIPVAAILAFGFVLEVAARAPDWSRQPHRIAARIRNAEPGTVVVTPQGPHQDLPSGVFSNNGGPMVYLWAPGMRKNHVLICYVRFPIFDRYPDTIEAVPARTGPMDWMSKALNGRVNDEVRSVCEPYLPPIVDGRLEGKWR